MSATARSSCRSEDVCARAIALASRAISLSDPNSRVGCVLARADGGFLACGHTQPVGGPHAEIMTLSAARAAGHDVRGATAYVTLDPCSHHGRTPPCCDELIEAGTAKVVVAIEDPNPLAAGRGIARLRSRHRSRSGRRANGAKPRASTTSASSRA